MTTEFHVFNHIASDHKQSYVFEIDRDELDKIVEFKDLYIITQVNNNEVRTRLTLDKMVQKMLLTIGGNVDNDTVEDIIKIFHDVMPQEKVDQYCVDVMEKEISKMDTDILIKANEYLSTNMEEINETDRGTTS